MHLRPPRNHQRTPNPRNHRPIKREDTHPEPILDPEQLIEHHIVRRDPAYPREHRQSLEEVPGEEEEEEGTAKDVEEVPVARYRPRRRVLVLGVERVQQGADDEVLRPDHACWPDEESSTETGEAEAGELSGEDKDETEPEAELDFVVVLSDDDGGEGVWRTDGDVGHDEDEDVFLDVPRTGVEGDFVATEEAGKTEDADRECVGEEFAPGVGDEEEHEWPDGGCRRTEVEEDIRGT